MKTLNMTLRTAFEAEHARREADRRARAEAERLRQEADHARAVELHDAIAADPDFLAQKKLVLELSRYTVVLEHADYRLRAYFEDGQVNVTSADKRTASTPTAAPRKQAYVESVEQALDTLAQYLADETR
jgi:hypothetical protein